MGQICEPFLRAFTGDCKSILHIPLQSKASLMLLQVDGFKSLPRHLRTLFLICPIDRLSSPDVLVLTNLYRLILLVINAHLFGNSLSKSFGILLLVSESVYPDNSVTTAEGISQYNPGDPESNLQKIGYFVWQVVEGFFWLFLCLLLLPPLSIIKYPLTSKAQN